MHPLAYKQQRQLLNAVRHTIRSPRQLLAFLVVLGYGGASMGMIIPLLLLPIPAELRDFMRWFGIAEDLHERLQSLRGALTVTLLMIASTAAFQNPLLRFAPADRDILFTTPVPLWRVMLGRLLLNHTRALLAGYFFWGLMLVPLLRLAGYNVWPLGIWGLLALMLLFSSVDQSAASLQLALSGHDAASVPAAAQGASRPAASIWPGRVVLLLVGLLALVLTIGVIGRLVSGTWAVLDVFLQSAGGPLVGTVLLPLGLATDLLLLPAHPGGAVVLPLALLLLLDAATARLLLRQISRGGASIVLETALAPDGRPSRLDELLVEVGFNPLRFIAVLWRGSPAAPWEQTHHAALVPCFGEGAAPHIWRRLTELQRTPLGNLIAVLVLGLVPLALYDPSEGYSLSRLLTAMIISSSLGTQLFNDAADHLRYANLELSTPVARWRLLLYAHLPRLGLYWLGGLLLLAGAGLLSPAVPWFDLAALVLWYPLVLIPLLSLRGALVFLYPAAGLPGQRDPVQAMLVTLINGVLVLIVILLSLLPFGVLLMLIELVAIGRPFFWLVIYLCSGLIACACCILMVWSYQRYEPGE